MPIEEGTNERVYIVLRFDPTTRPNEALYEIVGCFWPVGSIDASSPAQAVRRLVGDETTGTFIAVPERNWTVVNQESEPQPPRVVSKLGSWGSLVNGQREEVAS